jgi:hypothetical protein
MKLAPLLRKEMGICDKHCSRFLLALGKLTPVIPFQPAYLLDPPDEDLGYLELLTSRFMKIQDVLSRKIIPLMLRVIQEDQPTFTFLDRLHKLEQLGLIDDLDFWQDIRELRNSVAHDYPDDLFLAEKMNQCVLKGQTLIQNWKKISAYIEGIEGMKSP